MLILHSIGYLKYPVKAFFEPSGGKIVKLFVMSLLENISRGKMWASVSESNTESVGLRNQYIQQNTKVLLGGHACIQNIATRNYIAKVNIQLSQH